MAARLLLLLLPIVATKPTFVTSKPPTTGLDDKLARQEAAAAPIDPFALGAPCSSGMFHDSSVWPVSKRGLGMRLTRGTCTGLARLGLQTSKP